MTFGNTPKDNAATPLGSVYVPNTTGSDLTALEGTGINTDGNGQKSSPARMSFKDGDDVTQGLIADAGVTGDNPGTLSAKLRGLTIISGTAADANTINSVMGRLTKIRDLLAGTLSASITNATTLGQALMNASSPVVIASDQSAVKIKSDSTEQAALSAGALNADLVASTDVSAYRFATLHIGASAYSGTLTLQGSNDGANFVSLSGYNLTTPTYNSSSTTFTTSSLIVAIPLNTRYLRVRMTAYTSGTAQGVLELYTVPPGPYPFLAGGTIQVGTWTMQPGNTPNTTPWLVSAGPPADLTLLASGAQTLTQTLADQANFSGKGIRVTLDVTVPGTGSITLEIDAKDPASGKYIALLTGAAVTTTSTNVYVIHPELTAAANSIAKDVLPHTWRVKVVANNANSVTYSVGSSYLN